MICPECHKGMIPHPTPNRARASDDYGKVILCRRCKGSGIVSPINNEDVGEPAPSNIEATDEKEVESMVA